MTALVESRREALDPGQLNSVMNLNIALGVGGTMWFTVSAPQAIFNVFFKNHLGATSSELGLLVGIVQLTAVFNLIAIFLFNRFNRRKPLWITAHTIHRLFAFVLAGVAFRAAGGGEVRPAISLIFWLMAVSWTLANMSVSGWWSWIADLFPENIRAAFFGRRSAVINSVNIFWFFLVTILLDVFSDSRIFVVYGVVFAIAGILGILDTLLHIFIPEPRSEAFPRIGLKDFLEPIADRNFRRFSLSLGLLLFSVNIFAPFVAPYITSKEAIGAPNTWIGIMFVMSQLVWIGTAHFWGIVMDRFGRKPVVIFGSFFTLSWIGYYFLAPGNYTIVLPIISLTAGILAPAFWEGSGQLMLSLTPQYNRISYVAWYNTIVGLITAAGAFTGGRLSDIFKDTSIRLTPHHAIGGIQIVLTLSLVLIAVSIFILRWIREDREREVGYVLSHIAKPGIFRTYLTMGTLSRTVDSSRIAKALRSIEESSGHIVTSDVLGRLNDPDQEVREEAAKALGRIGSTESFEALVEVLQDPESTIRPHAARALGRIGDPRAIPILSQGLADESEDVQEASATALGMIGGDDSIRHLLTLFKETKSERVKASGAEAVSRLGTLEAVWEIFPMIHRSINPVLRRQLIIAMGNLLGSPGEFYRFMTGNQAQRQSAMERLFSEASRNMGARIRTAKPQGKDRLISGLNEVKDLLNRSEDRDAARKIVEIGKGLLEIMTDYGKAVDTAADWEAVIERAFMSSRKLGAWAWLLRQTELQLQEGPAPALRGDAILSVYYLSVYGKEEKAL